MLRALVAFVVLMAACVPISAQAVVPVFTDYSPTVKGVTVAGVTCTVYLRVKDYFATSPWDVEVACTNPIGTRKVEVWPALGPDEEADGSYRWQGLSVRWIVTAGSLHLAAQAGVGGVEAARDFTF